MMMRAATYTGAGGTEVIALRDDVDEPAIGPDDALVRVAYAGLNRADVLERRGLYPTPQRDVAIPGLEFAGTVAAIGARVEHVAVGDRVCGLVTAGAHAERVATHALALAKVPDGMSLATAAAIPEAFVTAHDALFARGRFALGEIAVVHAVGSGVGLAALALVKRAGGIAFGTSRTPDKLERARGLGLDEGFLLGDDWAGRVQTASRGRGADVILDFVGAPLLAANLAALAPRGRIVQIGTMGGAQGSLNLGVLLVKRAELHGTVLRSRAIDEKIALTKMLERELLPLFARGDLATVVDRVFPLADLAEAHAHMEADRNFGKIAIAVAPESS